MGRKGASSERREFQRQPIRLKVSFRSARSLVTEYTTSVSKGGCQLRAKKGLKPGTRFVFEMFARDADEPVKVEGEVVRSMLGPDGLYEVGVRYVASSGERAALAKLLEEIVAEQRFEKARRHPRIPVNLVARDSADASRLYLVRDLSRGGLGLRLPDGQELPPALATGRKVWLEVTLVDEKVDIAGQVVWSTQGRAGFTHAGAGVAFEELEGRRLSAFEALARLERPKDLALRFE